MSGGGSGGGSNTTTQIQKIPDYEQAFSQENQDLARSLASQPFPQYQAPLVQGLTDLQQAGQTQAVNSSLNYQPLFGQAQQQVQTGLDKSQFQNGIQNQTNYAQSAFNLTDPNAVKGYISPYIEAALAPQIQDLQIQQAQQQQGINTQATQANAYGDARQGAAQGLQNLYGNQALNQLIGTGYNNAYSQALGALGQAQQGRLGVASQFSNQAGLANQQQQLQLQGGQQLGQFANQQQQQELAGANAVYNAGQQQQQVGQQQLNTAYQQFLNQSNWPYQQLNIRESALSNSPYNIQNSVTLPEANSTATGLGSLLTTAGLFGSLSQGNGANPKVFGGG